MSTSPNAWQKFKSLAHRATITEDLKDKMLEIKTEFAKEPPSKYEWPLESKVRNESLQDHTHKYEATELTTNIIKKTFERSSLTIPSDPIPVKPSPMSPINDADYTKQIKEYSNSMRENIEHHESYYQRKIQTLHEEIKNMGVLSKPNQLKEKIEQLAVDLNTNKTEYDQLTPTQQLAVNKIRDVWSQRQERLGQLEGELLAMTTSTGFLEAEQLSDNNIGLDNAIIAEEILISSLSSNEENKTKQTFQDLKARFSKSLKQHRGNLMDSHYQRLERWSKTRHESANLGSQLDMCEKLEEKMTEITAKNTTLLEELPGKLEKCRERIIDAIVPAMSSRPTVAIFKHKPYLETIPDDYIALQEKLVTDWGSFVWPEKTSITSDCGPTSTLNIAQEIAVHYFNPFNKNITGILLDHSAGAGKSATAALIASAFVRENCEKRAVVWVTKEGLGHLGREGIKLQSDYNIQQYTNGAPLLQKVKADLVNIFMHRRPELTHDEAELRVASCLSEIGDMGTTGRFGVYGNGQIDEVIDPYLDEFVDTLYESDQKSEFEGAVIWAEHKILEKMGVRWKLLRYHQLAKFGSLNKKDDYKAGLAPPPEEYSAYLNNGKGLSLPFAAGQDPFRGCLIVIDEAHLLVVAEKITQTITDSRKLLERCLNIKWTSDAISGENACKWLLLTATPQVDHPLDVMNLSLFLNSRAMATQNPNLTLYMNVNATETDKKTGNAQSEKSKTQKLFEMEFMDSSTNTFTEEAVKRFSTMLAGKCSVFNYAGEQSRFATPNITFIPIASFNQAHAATLLDKCIFGTDDVDVEDGTLIENTSKKFSYDKDTRKLVKKGTGKQPDTDTLGMQTCMQREVMLLATKSVDFMKEKFKKGINDEALASAVPILKALLLQIEIDSKQAVVDLKAMGSDVTRKKQIIHVDLKTNGDRLGTRLVVHVLEKIGGYKRLNPFISNKSKGKLQKQTLLAPDKEYKSMIVLDNGLEQQEFKEYRKECIDLFNGNNNKDGKHCMLLINTHRFRESISFFGVGSIHVLGYVSSRSYLIQAAFRAIRNCSHVSQPHSPENGWQINVRMYTPTFPASTLTGMGLVSRMHKELEYGVALQEQMEAILERTAFDAKLLSVINRRSSEVLSRFQTFNRRQTVPASTEPMVPTPTPMDCMPDLNFDEIAQFLTDSIPDKYYLTIDQVQKVKNGQSIRVLQPQLYNEITTLDKHHVSITEDQFQGEMGEYATTGSGSNNWYVFDAGFQEYLEKQMAIQRNSLGN